jgi:HEAT repeat protein
VLRRWTEDLESRDPAVRSQALQELQKLGPEAREAVPALIAALEKVREDRDLCRPLVETLGAIGPDARAAVPLLLSLMGPSGASVLDGLGAPASAILLIGGAPDVERRALSNLLSMRHPRWSGADEEALLEWIASHYPIHRTGPYLVEMLSDGRTEGAWPLAKYGAAAVPLLLPLLRQHTGQAQEAYIYALKAIGEPAVPALRQELRGASVAGRVGAARTLGGLGAEAAFEALAAGLDDDAAEVRYAAAVALVRIAASRAGAAVPALVAGLESADAGTRREAADMLARLARAGRPAEEALPALKGLLADPEARLAAALALVEIDAGRAAAAVPVLVEALEPTGLGEMSHDTGSGVSEEAILAALGRIGPPAAAAVPLLRRTLASDTVAVRARGAVSLARVAPEWTADAVGALLPLLRAGEDYDRFWEGVGALGAIGPAAREAVPRLEEWLFADEEKRGISGVICPGPGDAVPELCSALARIDPTAPARVLARLEADLRSPERFDQAVKLLLELVAAVPAAAPLLAGLLQDGRAEGRWDAIRAALGGARPQVGDVPPGRGGDTASRR